MAKGPRDRPIYRTLPGSFWDSRQWTSVTPEATDARLLLVWLAVGPVQRAVPGVLRIGEGGIADNMGWTIERTRTVMQQLEDLGVLQFDQAAQLVWMPWRIEHEPPNAATVGGSTWRSVFERWPQGELAAKVRSELRVWMAHAGFELTEAFDALPGGPGVIAKPAAPPPSPSTVAPTVLGDPPPPPSPSTVAPTVLGDQGSSDAVMQGSTEEETKPLSADEPPTGQMLSLLTSPEAKATDLALEVFEHWKRAIHKTAAAKFDKKRRGFVEKQLKTGRTVADLCKAIDGCAGDAWHMENKQHELSLICRDAEHVEKFIGYADAPRRAQSGPGRFKPLTGTKERFKDMDDGDPLGLAKEGSGRG